jgi:hypothetical protein
MSWDYRVVKTTEKSKFFSEPVISYGIHEVYYNKDGKINGVTEEPARIIGDNHLELYDTVDRIVKCLNKKTVIYETLEEEI